jgi:ketosteroid isomerase-like protein
MSAGNLEAVQDYYAAAARGDVDGMLGFLSPGVEWTEMAGFPYAGTYRGVDEVVANVFARIGSEWEDFRVDVDTFVDGGETIAVVNTYGGTYKATGKPMSARAVHVWRVRDGRAVGFEQFVDTLKVAEALES